jgi:hypothetical protein
VACDQSATGGLCSDYLSVPANETAAYQNGCTGNVGTACPQSNAVGCCTFSNSGPVTITYCYYAPDYTAASVMQVCTNGTYTPTP